ncbi:MAG: response regulator transcription factor [Prevotella sp.]|nr:response regulator transcription factor [Prevotella sp.]
MKQYRIDINIADDHAMFCEALAEAVNRTQAAHLSRMFSSVAACRRALEERRPDVLLLDITMNDEDVEAFCREALAAYPKMKIIIITVHDEYSVIRRMLDTGVHGYLLKSSSVDELITAIQRVWRGERYISSQVSDIIDRSKEHSIQLTDIERSILRLICQGLSNPRIAEELCLSSETVNWYRKRMLSKFGVKNTAGMVTIAVKEMLV